MINWQLAVNQREGAGDVMNVVYVYASWLANGGALMPSDIKQQLDDAKLTREDYNTILSTNPFTSGVTTPPPNRYALASRTTIPYEPPQTPDGSVATTTHTLTNENLQSSTQSVQLQYSVNLTTKSGFIVGSLEDSENVEWTNTSSTETTASSTQSASAEVGGPAYGYGGPTEIDLYLDTVFNTFAFVFKQPATTS